MADARDDRPAGDAGAEGVGGALTKQSTESDQSPAEGNTVVTDGDEPNLPESERSFMKKLLRTTLLESKNEVQVQRSDPNSPLYSVHTFEELKLRDEFLRAIYKMGFQKPSKIQETALPTLIADPPINMIAQSQSGTGKTATFLLASLSRVDENLKYPQVLILSPTFELAKQTATVAQQMLQFCQKIEVKFVVRGQILPPGSQIQEQIVIGTPGKMIDWALKFRFFDISKIKVFVLDEADVMIAERGHHDQSIRIHRKLSADCQMMLFSATYDKDVIQFADMIIPDPCIKITLKREEESLENIGQYVMHCPDDESKQRALLNIYSSLSVGQAVIFCHTKVAASTIARAMKELGQSVSMLTGDLDMEERVQTIERFRSGIEKVMVTTNLCARGIDIEQVSLVVNFDLPVNEKGDPDFETYLHRIGRTGRFGKTGVAINFVNPNSPRDMMNIKRIEEHFKRNIIPIDFEDFELLEKIGTQS
ncbi:DEAD-box helicase Dbp80 [Galendromus occidentalis]|uniref:RNA helicase n=1 Tax=Galendromus occidentalis TaxID=34638 RepID=A0AAJ6QS95_9ACAR|nr:DEAD-box helicase Dbp80 [Galendromus occidentalis]